MIVCFFLTGCTRVVRWVSSSVPQIRSLDVSCDTAQDCIKSAIFYDQLTTACHFDVLWLSDKVRELYTDLAISRTGKSLEQKDIVLRRQLEENNHFISFYVLSLYECPLADPYSPWTIFLTINSINYTPIEIKIVDLSPEYTCIFGKKINAFKVAYSVKFDIKNANEELIINENTDKMTLYFRSIKKEASVEWDLL